jgi:hypothetical protein
MGPLLVSKKPRVSLENQFYSKLAQITNLNKKYFQKTTP